MMRALRTFLYIVMAQRFIIRRIYLRTVIIVDMHIICMIVRIERRINPIFADDPNPNPIYGKFLTRTRTRIPKKFKPEPEPEPDIKEMSDPNPNPNPI
jgi:hypothetical protein